MDYNRVFQILTMELTSDILKSEDELERLMNSNIDINEKISKFFEKENKSAGTRLRKGMQEVKALAQTLRVNVSDAKKNN